MNSTFSFIGIDFSTSKSTMAWYDPKASQAKIIRNAEGEEKTPSVVYFGKGETLVGTPAEQMLEDQEDPETRKRVIVSVKRSLVNSPTLALPGRRVKAIEVAAEILRKLKDDAEKLHFHQPVTHAVITCPAAFDLLQRDEIEKAGKLAGFSEVQLLEEPVAAALAYAHEGLHAGNYLLVYDLGGGTFDVAVLAREGDEFHVALEPKGMARCGGDDFDQALYDYCDEVAQQTLGRAISPTGEIDLHFLRLCRQWKEFLSSRERITLSALLASETGAVQFKHTIERTKFEELIRGYAEATVRLTKDLLQEATAAGLRVDTVVLIGGSSCIPLVQTLLKEALPVQPKEWHQQDRAVALGAACYANSLWGSPAKQQRAGFLKSARNQKEGIFISYARKDREKAQILAEAFTKRGWPVWWDPALLPGDHYAQLIQEALNAARCVVVLWSKNSVGSIWVNNEATIGVRRNTLVPALLDMDDNNIPLQFLHLQGARLVDWSGTFPQPEFDKLLEAVTSKLES